MARRKAVPKLTDEILVNLNARVPRDVWRRMRLHCLRKGCLLRAFITEALEERLRRERRRQA